MSRVTLFDLARLQNGICIDLIGSLTLVKNSMVQKLKRIYVTYMFLLCRNEKE
jgi:hypothetical protein